MIVGNFRERALSGSERELENTVLLLARDKFGDRLEVFELAVVVARTIPLTSLRSHHALPALGDIKARK